MTSQSLRGMREESALSLAELADAAHLSVGAIWKLETGRTTAPHPKTVRKLAEFYGVTPDTIRAAIVALMAAA